MKDKSYRSTPIGLEVAHFMRWFRNEYGATQETLRDYEAILAKLAIDHADLELVDFEPPAARPASASSSTSAGAMPLRGRARRCAPFSCRSSLGAGGIQAPGQSRRPDPEPAAPRHRASALRPRRRRPDRRGPARAPRSRRAQALFLIGLRKGELAQLRSRTSTSAGAACGSTRKGGKIRTCPSPPRSFGRSSSCSSSAATERVPALPGKSRRHAGRRAKLGEDKAEIAVVHANRLKPLSRPRSIAGGTAASSGPASSSQGRQGNEDDGARYTAGTEFYLATGDI